MSRMIDADALKDALKDESVEKIIENIKEIEVGRFSNCKYKCKSYDWSVGACQGNCEDYVKSEAIDIVKRGVVNEID